MNQLLTTGKAPTMNSREIAELVGSRHDNVRVAIERLAARGVIEIPAMQEIPTATKPVAVYVFSGERGRRDSIVLVAQLSPEFTARLVDRWQELEKQLAAQALPDFSNPAIAARAWAEQFEQREQLAIENKVKAQALAIAEPKAHALDLIAADDKALTVTQAAKVLSIKREKLTAWLSANGWMYRQNGSWVAYQQHIQNGRLRYKEARYTDDNTGQEVYRPYCHITPKGLAKLAQVFSQEVA